MNKEIKLWAIKDNYRPDNDFESKLLEFTFGLSSESAKVKSEQGKILLTFRG